MYKQKKIAVVVPAFNEEENIQKTLETVPEFVDHILVVDDGSTDKTIECALKRGDKRITIIQHKTNLGVGAAVVSGHKKALELDAYASVVMAGDGQMNPEYLPKLLDALIEEGYHYAKGNRFLARKTLCGMPKSRIIGNVVLTFMNKLSSGYWNIFDPQNGYTAVKTSVLRELDLDELAKGYQFENDMLLRLGIRSLRVKDVPMPAQYDKEKSKIRLPFFIPKTFLFLLKGFYTRIYHKYVIRDFHPIALLLLSGIPLVLWGILFGGLIAYYSIGPETASTGSVMLAVLPFNIGFILVLAAFLLDIIESPRDIF